jgi:hypothetical protein
MTTCAVPRLAAVVLPARGGARLTEALDAVRWADRRAVLAVDDLPGTAALPPDVARIASPARLEDLDAEWILVLGEEERVAPEDVPELRDAIAAALPAQALALSVVTGALDMRVRLGRGVARLARRGARLDMRPGFDMEFRYAERTLRTLDVTIARSRGTTLTDAVELAGADAAMLAAIVDRGPSHGRGILWDPVIAAVRTLVARAVGGRLGTGRWILAVLEGYRVVVAYAKLWERRRDRAVVLE